MQRRHGKTGAPLQVVDVHRVEPESMEHTRGWIADSASAFSSRAWSVMSFGGKSAWVITTSILFLGVPFALSFHEDLQYAAMEQEYNMRQTGGDMLTGGAEEQSTADKVGAALAAEG